MINTIIFDFDGTLVDSKDLFIRALNQLSDKYKFTKLNYDDVEQLKRMSYSERFKYLQLPFYKMPFLAVDLTTAYKQSMNELVLFDGIEEMLQQLKERGLTLAIISSNSEENIREFLSQNNITCIDYIFTSSNIFGKDKVIDRFLKDHQLKKEHVIYVGDEIRDIIASRKSGIKMVWVEWGYDLEEMVLQEQPDYVAQTPFDITKVV